jgi:hypothetical protein
MPQQRRVSTFISYLLRRGERRRAQQFGFEFTDEYLDTRMQAYKLGGEPAIRQFDRSWQAAAAKKSREYNIKSTD